MEKIKTIKIKDSVALKILITYGFVFNDENGTWTKIKMESCFRSESIVINSWNRIISIDSSKVLSISQKTLCTIFELINDGLVEEIEVEK